MLERFALLLWTTVAVGAIAIGFPYMGPLAAAFGFEALPWPLAGTMLLVVAAYVFTTEAAKGRAFRSTHA